MGWDVSSHANVSHVPTFTTLQLGHPVMRLPRMSTVAYSLTSFTGSTISLITSIILIIFKIIITIKVIIVKLTIYITIKTFTKI